MLEEREIAAMQRDQAVVTRQLLEALHTQTEAQTQLLQSLLAQSGAGLPPSHSFSGIAQHKPGARMTPTASWRCLSQRWWCAVGWRRIGPFMCRRPGHFRRECLLMEVGHVIRVAGPPTLSPGLGGTYRVPVRIQGISWTRWQPRFLAPGPALPIVDLFK